MSLLGRWVGRFGDRLLPMGIRGARNGLFLGMSFLERKLPYQMLVAGIQLERSEFPARISGGYRRRLGGLRAMERAVMRVVDAGERWPLWLCLVKEEVLVRGWVSERWSLKAVNSARGAEGSPVAISPEECWTQAPDLQLFDDERPAYRFNLSSANPRLFVVCAEDEEGRVPEPLLVTLSQDEAAAYLDGDGQAVFSLPLPEAIHCWAEAYIGRHGEPDLGLSRGKRRRLRGKSAGDEVEVVCG